MLKILQITDMHILPEADETLMGVNTDESFAAVLNQAFRQHQHFDLILLTGDLAQTPTPKSYQRIINRLKAYNTACLCLPGNHDDTEVMNKVMNNGNISSAKANKIENWQIICLNSQIPGSADGALSPAELEFLTRQLEKHSTTPTLIAVHHNCLPTECSWLDTMMIKNSEEFLHIIRQHSQVKLVSTGHIHQEMKRKYHNIPILGTPASCFQFKRESSQFAIDNKPPGYRVLNLENDGSFSTQVYWLDEIAPGLNPALQGY